MPLGLNFGSNAENSSEVCQQELKKLESSSFVKKYSEVFSEECGNFLASKTQQCLNAATVLAKPTIPMSLQCNVSQSRDHLVVNTWYTAIAGEGPDSYRIESASGIKGVACETGILPGVSQYGSFTCTLPEEYFGGKLIVRLKNSASCTINVAPPMSSELSVASKYSCAAIFSDEAGDDFSPLLKYAIVGACGQCLQKNLATGSTDSRSLASRLEGCAVWAAYISVQAKIRSCEVKNGITAVSNNPGMTGKFIASYENPFEMTTVPGAEQIPQMQATTIGTSRGKTIFIADDREDIKLVAKWAGTLCNGRGQGEIIEFTGELWRQPPIGFIYESNVKSELLRRIRGVINKRITELIN